MKNAAKYAWSFSRNSSFLRGLFFMPHPVCVQCNETSMTWRTITLLLLLLLLMMMMMLAD